MSDANIVTITNSNGKQLFVLDSDFIMKRNLKNTPFQHLNLRFVRSIIKRGRRCIDAGASLGMNAVEYADFFDAVDAFEPDPVGFMLLNKTLTANHAVNVNPYDIALGDRGCILAMHCFAKKTGLSSFVIDGSGSESVKVDMTTIDGFGFDDVDFIKVDVEGYECNVIEGARDTITRCRPLLQVEINHAENPQDILDCVFSINPDYRSFVNTGGCEGKKYRYIKGKIDRFFLLQDVHGKKGLLY